MIHTVRAICYLIGAWTRRPLASDKDDYAATRIILLDIIRQFQVEREILIRSFLSSPRIRRYCPMLGKVKIAQALARAGLHLGATTVGRILKEEPTPKPTEDQNKDGASAMQCPV